MNYIEEIKKENLIAFDLLYEESKKSVFYAIYLIVKSYETTEDLMQETYMDFLSNIKKLKNDIDPVAWIVTSAKNKAINYYNRNKREAEFASMLESFTYSSDKYLDTGLLEKIQKVLDKKEFEVFVLRVLGEYSFKEISKITNTPTGTLTWMYQESRKKLQDEFGGKF